MGRCKAGPSPKKQHASTSIESCMLNMPHEEEELDVNELKGSNQISKETKVLISNDQNTTTIVHNIDKTPFDDGQKRDNKGLGTESQDMLQNMSKARKSTSSQHGGWKSKYPHTHYPSISTTPRCYSMRLAHVERHPKGP
jgi:hypothetical protein